MIFLLVATGQSNLQKFWIETGINKSLINADCSKSSTGTYSGLKQSHKIFSKGRLRKKDERLEDKKEVESETAYRSFWKRFWAE